MTLTFDIRSLDINHVTSRYEMQLFTIYEENCLSGLGEVREHTHTKTDRQTYRVVTSINNIDLINNIDSLVLH